MILELHIADVRFVSAAEAQFSRIGGGSYHIRSDPALDRTRNDRRPHDRTRCCMMVQYVCYILARDWGRKLQIERKLLPR